MNKIIKEKKVFFLSLLLFIVSLALMCTVESKATKLIAFLMLGLTSFTATRNLTFSIGIFMVGSTLMVAVFADVLAPYAFDEMIMGQMQKPPSKEFLFGTDNLARDMYSRVIYGTRIAMQVAILAVIIQTSIGVTVGLVSGYFGGRIDDFLSFVTDLTWSMPPLIMALAVITILGSTPTNVVIAIAVVSWAQFSRIVRSKTQALKELPFVEMGVTIGESKIALITKYILPNIIPSIIVIATISIPNMMMATTGLSFLGLGSQPPSPDWGVMLRESVTRLEQAPWLAIYPGLAMAYAILGFNLLGEGLRDILDPRLKL